MYQYFLFGYVFATVTGMISTDCPRSWVPYQQSCYFFSDSAVSWHDASSDCKAFHSELVMIESAAENDFIVNYLKQHTDKFPLGRFWTGGTDLIEEKHWIWAATLQPLIYRNWMPGEPNEYNGQSEDCLEIDGKYKNYRWNDNQCDGKDHFICEFKLVVPTTTTTSPPTTKTTTTTMAPQTTTGQIASTYTVTDITPVTSSATVVINQTTETSQIMSSRIRTTNSPYSTSKASETTKTQNQKQSTPTKSTSIASTTDMPVLIG